MTVFQDATAAHSRAVDAVYSEHWQYQPFAAAAGDVNGRPSPDPDRRAMPVIGVYLAAFARAFSAQTVRQGLKPEKPGHASARPQLDLDVTQLPYPVKNGDRVLRCQTGELFHVAEPKFPSAGQRQQLDLNLI